MSIKLIYSIVYHNSISKRERNDPVQVLKIISADGVENTHSFNNASLIWDRMQKKIYISPAVKIMNWLADVAVSVLICLSLFSPISAD